MLWFQFFKFNKSSLNTFYVFIPYRLKGGKKWDMDPGVSSGKGGSWVLVWCLIPTVCIDQQHPNVKYCGGCFTLLFYFHMRSFVPFVSSMHPNSWDSSGHPSSFRYVLGACGFLKLNFVTGSVREALLCVLLKGSRVTSSNFCFRPRENRVCGHKITPSANRVPFESEHSKYSRCFPSHLSFPKPYMVGELCYFQ